MKIHTSDIEQLEQNPLDLFYDGCRSPATKERYTRYLHTILCDIYETVLEGTFEQRANKFVRKAKSDPDWTINLLLALSKKLKERTTLPKQDRDYLNPTSFGNYFKPLKKLLDMNGVPVVWKRVNAPFVQLIPSATIPIELGIPYATNGINNRLVISTEINMVFINIFRLLTSDKQLQHIILKAIN